MYEKISEFINPILNFLSVYSQHVIAGYLLIAVIGIVFGCKKKIVVFEDFDDLWLCFALTMLPIGSLFLFCLNQNYIRGPIGIALLVIEAFLVLLILMKTWKSNNSFFGFLLSFITKIPFSIFYSLSLLQSISPTGKNFDERNRNRQGGIAFLFLLTPLLLRLVKNKNGFWIPKNISRSALREAEFEDDTESFCEDTDSEENGIKTNIKIAQCLSKEELKAIATASNIEFNPSATKAELVNIVAYDKDVELIEILLSMPLERQKEIVDKLNKSIKA